MQKTRPVVSESSTVRAMPPGRKRDDEAAQRILDATFRLISERGTGQVPIDEIAAAASVGKQTIYRWWPSKTVVVLDALVAATLEATPFPDTADARADLRTHLQAVARLFSSPTGALICELVAEAQAEPAVADELRRRFWAPRRALSRARLTRAVEEGQVRADLPVEAALDALYGPLWLALLVGHRRPSRRYVDEVLESVWPGWVADGPAT